MDLMTEFPFQQMIPYKGDAVVYLQYSYAWLKKDKDIKSPHLEGSSNQLNQQMYLHIHIYKYLKNKQTFFFT